MTKKIDNNKKIKNKKPLGNKILTGAMVFITAATCVGCNVNQQQNLQNNQQNLNEFKEIPVALQKKTYTYSYSQSYSADFFSSYANYAKLYSDDNRYVDLREYKTSYVFYDGGLPSTLITEIKNAANYLQSVLRKIDSSYTIVVQEGKRGVIGQLFCKDSIYFCYTDKDKLKEIRGEGATDNGALAITTLSPITPPKVYVDYDRAREVQVDGKEITLNRVVLHEMLHGYGFKHTTSWDDIMYCMPGYFKDSRGKWKTKIDGKEVFVTDYSKFSDNEIRTLIYNFGADKTFEQKCKIYETIKGIKAKQFYTKANFQQKCDTYLKEHLDEVRNSNVGTALKENQILCIKQATGNMKYVLNGDYVGWYKVYENGKLTGTGQYFLIDSKVDDVTMQSIVLAPTTNNGSAVYLRPNRINVLNHQIYYTRFSGNAKYYYDQTEEWLSKNNIQYTYNQTETNEVDNSNICLADLLGIEMDFGWYKNHAC